MDKSSNFINVKTKKGKWALFGAISTLGATTAIITSYYVLKKEVTFWDQVDSMNFILGDEPGVEFKDKKNLPTPDIKAQSDFLSSHFASDFEKGNEYWQNVLMLRNLFNKSPLDLANQNFYLVNEKNMPFYALSEQFSRNKIRSVNFESYGNDILGILFLELTISYKIENSSKELTKKFFYQIEGFKKFKDVQKGSNIQKELARQADEIEKIDLTSDVSKYKNIKNNKQLEEKLINKSLLEDQFTDWSVDDVKIVEDKIIMSVTPKLNYKNYYLVNKKLKHAIVTFVGATQKIVLDFKKYEYLKQMSQFAPKIKPINKDIKEFENTFFQPKFQNIKIYDNYKDDFPNKDIQLELDRNTLSSLDINWENINNSEHKITQKFKNYNNEFGYATYEIIIKNAKNFIASFEVRFNNFKTLLSNELNELNEKYSKDKSLLAFKFVNEGNYKKYTLKQLVNNADENGKEIYNKEFFNINAFIKVIDANIKSPILNRNYDIQVKIVEDSFKLEKGDKNKASFKVKFYLRNNKERYFEIEFNNVDII
ncbi:hypothetical protein QLQ80_00320 [Mycoplasma sp. M5725]|uniref:Uncharacterized protein n=1 Tax=Mycoplasma phocimorsus TaxID=3045839 RepID=A0AAJ1PS47_9MOLU|nr:hypothetical protein [Mycoplasma phocimorsus]MDJ1645536.1 hypothetical protein [Mycoplasma phocimorsus]